MSSPPAEKLSHKDAFELYESGKHRRYSLLFSVNGGAFAIAKLLVGDAAAAATGGGNSPGVIVLGDLTLAQLALGMALFSAVMGWDLWAFGEKMRRGYLRDAFGRPGKVVLVLLVALLCLGWLLVGARRLASG